jgi:hypothetical protein
LLLRDATADCGMRRIDDENSHDALHPGAKRSRASDAWKRRAGGA